MTAGKGNGQLQVLARVGRMVLKFLIREGSLSDAE